MDDPIGAGDVLELDHRTSGEVDVSLWWNRRANTVVLQVIDWADDEDFSVVVDPARALDAFRHAFAYAPGCGPAPEDVPAAAQAFS